jgi:vacuolar-type H+-ATPase catalytic subunit A/Vma1
MYLGLAASAALRRRSSRRLTGCPHVQVGDRITGGDIYGVVAENSLIEHRIMLPPGARGTVTYIAPSGHYTVEEEIIEVDFQGTKKVRQLPHQDRGTCIVHCG